MLKRTPLILLLPLFLLPLPTAHPFTGKVVGVTDGDTITVMHDGRGEKVRICGVDAPEPLPGLRDESQEVHAEIRILEDH